MRTTYKRPPFPELSRIQNPGQLREGRSFVCGAGYAVVRGWRSLWSDWNWRLAERIRSLLYTNRYMMAASPKAVSTSKKECCFKNIVDKIMETQRIPEPIRIPFLSESRSQCRIARCAPMELYTWMLGKRFVGVSVLYKKATSCVKILSRGITAGLK